jgi:hypothetical protein
LLRSAPARNWRGSDWDDAARAKCPQIIKEWTLRDSRRSVDEDGGPLK